MQAFSQPRPGEPVPVPSLAFHGSLSELQEPPAASTRGRRQSIAQSSAALPADDEHDDEASDAAGSNWSSAEERKYDRSTHARSSAPLSDAEKEAARLRHVKLLDALVASFRTPVPSGDWGDFDAFHQLIHLDASTERPLEYMASSWCRPDQHSSVLDTQIDSFTVHQIRVLLHICDMTDSVPIKTYRGYKVDMQSQLKNAVRSFAAAHPNIFDEDAPEPKTPVAFSRRAIQAQAVVVSAPAPVAVSAILPVSSRSSAAPTQIIRQASVAALNELPPLSRPSSSSIARRRAQPQASAAVAHSRAPSLAHGSVAVSSASQLSLLQNSSRPSPQLSCPQPVAAFHNPRRSP